MQSYSDYDSDGYSSNDDVDYVPSDDNLSEDDLSLCEKEDPLDEGDDVVVPHGHEGTTVAAAKKKKKKGQDITMRKRKKGGLKLEGEEKATEEEEEEKKKEEEKEEEEERTTEAAAASGQKQQKKADDLWASFLSDVGSSRPKPPPSSSSSTTTPSSPQSSSGARQVDTSVSKGSPSSSEPTARSSEPAKVVTITKVFDFAGEEVRVTKEVSADSREAKTYLKSQEEDRDGPPAPDKPLLQPGPSATNNKRPMAAGMSGLLSRLGGKKQKMSTLEKSKMDWDAFKSEEGITDELAIHNRGKGGYVERKNFLERVDHRQFEREKAVRLTHMKPPT